MQTAQRQIRRFLARVGVETGYFARRLRQNRDACVVLMYHSVADTAGVDPATAEVIRRRALRTFESEMRFVSRNLRPIALDELVSGLRLAKRVPPNTVVVTFDDGYEDNYSLAYPVLKKLAIPASIFLVTNHVDTGAPFWWDDLTARIRQTAQPAIDLRGLQHLLGEGCPPRMEFGAQREGSLRALAARLRHLHPDECHACLPLITERVVSEGHLQLPRLLSWDQVHEMHAGGIEFGAHTATHPNLGLLDADRAEREIQLSVSGIEARLQTPVRNFAYPFGGPENIGRIIKSRLSRLGVQGACSSIPGLAGPQSDPFEIPRLSWSAGSLPLSTWTLHRHLT